MCQARNQSIKQASVRVPICSWKERKRQRSSRRTAQVANRTTHEQYTHPPAPVFHALSCRSCNITTCELGFPHTPSLHEGVLPESGEVDEQTSPFLRDLMSETRAVIVDVKG